MRTARFTSRKSCGIPGALAFTLIEVTLALGVAGFCLVSIFGLLPVGLTSTQASMQQTMAGNIAGSIISDLRSTQLPALPLVSGTVSGTSPRFGIVIPAPPSPPQNTTAGTISTIAQQTIYFAANGSSTGATTQPAVSSGSAASLYRVTVAFGAPVASGASTQRAATLVRVFVTWPALADGNPAKWPANYSGSYDTETTLDRN